MTLSRREIIKSMAAALVLASRSYGQTGAQRYERRGDSVGVDPAYLSNGLIGIRPGRIPITPAPTCVAGFVYVQPDDRVESLSPAPYPLTTDIRVNGISLLESLERTTLRSQRLDMSNGELATEFTYDVGDGVVVSVLVRQVALRSEPSLLWQKIEVQPSVRARIEISPQVSTAGIPGRALRDGVPLGGRADRAVLFQSRGDLSQVGIAVQVIPDRGFVWQERSSTYSGDASEGATYVFHTLASMVSSFYHQEPDIEAIRLVHWGEQTGVGRLLDENRLEWKDLWKSRVVLNGNLDDQRALDAAFFYLHSSNHRSNLNGMAPFGLSSSRWYLGHSFWDTETWSFLPILLSSPRA